MQPFLFLLHKDINPMYSIFLYFIVPCWITQWSICTDCLTLPQNPFFWLHLHAQEGDNLLQKEQSHPEWTSLCIIQDKSVSHGPWQSHFTKGLFFIAPLKSLCVDPTSSNPICTHHRLNPVEVHMVTTSNQVFSFPLNQVLEAQTGVGNLNACLDLSQKPSSITLGNTTNICPLQKATAHNTFLNVGLKWQ